MRWFLVASGIVALLGGCNDRAPEAKNDVKQFDLNWTSLKDGSHFARVDLTDADRSEALRCWPVEGKGFECLRATVARSDAFEIKYVSRTSEATLPERSMAMGGGGSGYGCTHMMGYRERIERDGSTLVSNAVEYDSPRWTRGYVKRYMAENDVVGTGYFGCLDVLDAVMRGSLETLGTTSVTRAMLR